MNGEPIPVWIADYVLISYGTGAIMAVPAHDLRDWEFAVKFNLPIIPVVAAACRIRTDARKNGAGAATVAGRTESPFAGEGTAIASGEYDGLPTRDFKKKITADLAAQGLGRGAVNYRLRDWLFSRQHFWGEPFPIWHELDADGKPTGLMRTDSPNANCRSRSPRCGISSRTAAPSRRWPRRRRTGCSKRPPTATKLARETNTHAPMGRVVLVLPAVHRSEEQRPPSSIPAKEKAWMPVDLYIGGAEHAVLHLLYSRFWHKVLFDRGHVSGDEPFRRLVNQGMILGEAELTGYRTLPGAMNLPTSRLSSTGLKSATIATSRQADSDGRRGRQARRRSSLKKGNDFVLADDPQIIVESRAFKMSKSRGNVINPDTVVDEYGADSLRLYEMFMGPLDAAKPWSMSGVEGVSRFLARVWRMISDESADDIRLNPGRSGRPPDPEQLRLLHKTIQAVTNDIENLGFNTAISRMMEFVNAVSGQEPRPRAILDPFVLLLAPFAPHLAEEAWELLGHPKSLAYEPWPAFDPSAAGRNRSRNSGAGQRQGARQDRIPAGADQGAASRLPWRCEHRREPGGQAGRQSDLRPRSAVEFRRQIAVTTSLCRGFPCGG